MKLESATVIAILGYFASSANGLQDVDKKPQAEREIICANNKAECKQACWTSVEVNTCDSTTMFFQCRCKPATDSQTYDPITGYQLPLGEMPTVNIHRMPVQYYQCEAEQSRCVDGCIVDGATDASIEACSNQCYSKFSCGKPNAGEQKILGEVGKQVSLDDGSSKDTDSGDGNVQEKSSASATGVSVLSAFAAVMVALVA